MMPEFLFYILGYAVVIWYFYTYPMSRWSYSKTIFLCCMMLLGVRGRGICKPYFDENVSTDNIKSGRIIRSIFIFVCSVIEKDIFDEKDNKTEE